MALTLVNNTTNYLYRSGMPSAAPYTVAWWQYFNSVANHQGTGFDTNSPILYVYGGKLFLSGPAFYGSTTLSVNTWYHIALTKTGTSWEIFLNGASDGTGSGGSTPTSFSLSYRKAASARIEAWKWFDSVLSQHEIDQERWQNAPTRPCALWSPFTTPDNANFRDYSGNGRNWTEFGSLTQGNPGPPISFSSPSPIIVITSAGGPGTYTGTAAATITAATASSSGTFTAPVYTGTMAATAGAATASSSGTFTAPVYTGTMAATAGAATAAGSGQFNTAIYTGTMAATAGAATASSSGTFTAPVYTGTMAATAGAATAAGSGQFNTAIYTGTAAPTIAAATAAAAGVFTVPTYTGSATPTIAAATATASGTFLSNTYTGSSAATIAAATAAASGTMAADVDNLYQACGEELDLVFSALLCKPAANPSAACTNGTRPEAVKITITGVGKQDPTSGTHYSAACWQQVVDAFNQVHEIERTAGDTYTKTFQVNCGTSPLDCKVELIWTATGPTVQMFVESSTDLITPTDEVQGVGGVNAEYSCIVQYSGFTTTSSSGPDATEGGLIHLSTNIVVEDAGPPAPSGTLIFDWSPGQISASAWAAALAGLPTNAAGRPIGDQSYFQYGTGNKYWVRHQINYEQPTINATTQEFEFEAYTDASNPHTQFTLGGTSADLSPPYFLASPKRYRIYWTMHLDASEAALYASGVTWMILNDWASAGFPTGWVGSTNPCIALFARGIDDVFRLELRGADNGETNWEHETQWEWPLVFGRHDFVLEIELDHTGVSSFTKLWDNGVPRMESTAVNVVWDETESGNLFGKWGAYCSAASLKGQTVRLSKLSIYSI